MNDAKAPRSRTTSRLHRQDAHRTEDRLHADDHFALAVIVNFPIASKDEPYIMVIGAGEPLSPSRSPSRPTLVDPSKKAAQKSRHYPRHDFGPRSGGFWKRCASKRARREHKQSTKEHQ